jgi:hypothetical protein
VGSLFLLDQVFEDADVFGFWNLDTKLQVQLVTVNETVEAEKLCIGRLRGYSKTNRFRGDGTIF